MDTRWSKSYLVGIRSTLFSLRYLEDKIQDLKSKMISQGGSGDGVKVKSSPKPDGMENRVIKYTEELSTCERTLAKRYIELINRQTECVDRLNEMKEGRCRDFLYEYYVRGMSEIEYANSRGYETTESVRNLKWKALQYFETLAEENNWKISG